MKSAVLLLAHGAPERVEDVPAYLNYVRGGRPVAPRVVEEVRQRYQAIGGASPLLHWTRKQAEGLQQQLGVPVYIGMRNWYPFIAETMDQIARDGIERLAALALAPQYSNMSVGLYVRRAEEAARASKAAAEIRWATSFHDHPLLIQAFAERLAPLADGRKVLFTAHSLPEKILGEGDPYDTEARATARAVAKKAGVSDWDFAYQSQGQTDDVWLGPTVEATLDRLASQGVREIVVHPIGFVCDHVEVLYDVDVLFCQYAADRGMSLSRPTSLNDSPTFIAALAAITRALL